MFHQDDMVMMDDNINQRRSHNGDWGLKQGELL